MATLEKLVLDAKRISNRLSDKLVLGDSLINEIEFVNEQLKTLRTVSRQTFGVGSIERFASRKVGSCKCLSIQVHDKFDVLNELSRNKSNQNLAIQKKYPHIQEIQHENRELRACLQDYQRTMEHVMTKYREHTQQKILNSKFTFTSNTVRENRTNIFYCPRRISILNLIFPFQIAEDNSKHEQISEMVELMRRAAVMDEDKEFAGMELINKLSIENQGLREMLQISKEFGSQAANDENEERSEVTPEIQCNDDVEKPAVEQRLTGRRAGFLFFFFFVTFKENKSEIYN